MENDLVTNAKNLAIYHHDVMTNHKYDDKPYSFHLNSVVEIANRFLFLVDPEDRANVLAGCWLHDAIEDARLSYNDIKKEINVYVAEIVYALTELKGRTRNDRHNNDYYFGIKNTTYGSFVKCCDRCANIIYSKETGSHMFDLYKKENEQFIMNLNDGTFEELFKFLIKQFP